MTKLRLLIVDDEPLARNRLRSLLQEETAFEICGECSTGTDALAVISRGQMDVVLLDVQMPDGDGLQVVAGLPEGRRPAIIFVTAHHRFALEAFGAQAVDYLLKPFDQARLRLALSRATDYIRTQREEDLRARVESRLAGVPERRPERLTVKSGGCLVFLRPAEIIWVEAANNHSILHLADARSLVLRETLSALELRLGSVEFARVNRSAVVRIDRVKELQLADGGDYMVVLENGTRLPLSRQRHGWLDKLSPD